MKKRGNKPNSPYLELGFYFKHLQDEETLNYFFEKSQLMGCLITGRILVWRGVGMRSKSFGSRTDHSAIELGRIEVAEIRRLFNDPETKVLSVDVLDLIGINPAAYEIITLQSINAIGVDKHPITVLADGRSFDGRFPSNREAKTGLRVYKRFCEIVENTKPTYANISVELGLDCPSDLRGGPKGEFFKDFFINKLTERNLAAALLGL